MGGMSEKPPEFKELPEIHQPAVDVALAAKAKEKTRGLSRTVSREAVDRSIHDVFHLMGGVARMAAWAEENPDKFYPLYCKLMSPASANTGKNGPLTIEHAVPRSPLDGPREKDDEQG